MRWFALLVAALLAAPALGATGRQAAHPALRVVELSPLTVRGSGFARGEVVRVRYRAGAKFLVRTARTNGRGTFVARFAGVSAHPCSGDGIAVTARGATGDAAAAKLPQTLCPPPLAP